MIAKVALRREAVLAVVDTYWAEHGAAPSTDDILAGTDITSRSVVWGHLRALRHAGLVEFERCIARSVRLTGPGRARLHPPELCEHVFVCVHCGGVT